MKIPSRAKLERDLVRLKRAAGLRADSVNLSDPPSPSSTLTVKFETFLGRTADFLSNLPSFFQGQSQNNPSPPRLLGEHDITRVIQVVSEEPRFFDWFMYLAQMPEERRTGELRRMSEAMRLDPDSRDLAEILDQLYSPAVYESFCRVLQEEKKLKHA